MRSYVGWFNVHRPHQGLGQRTPDEVHFVRDTRARAVPLRASLAISHVDGERELPVLTLRRAGSPSPSSVHSRVQDIPAVAALRPQQSDVTQVPPPTFIALFSASAAVQGRSASTYENVRRRTYAQHSGQQ